MRTSLLRALLVSLLAVPAAGAQEAGRWAPWVGCWAPVNGTSGATTVTCVVPGASADAAELVTLVGDSVVQRSTITADGVSRPIDGEGCRGTETARFTEDGSRVLIAGEVRCGDGAVQRTSGIMSISETGQWVDVNGVQVGAQHSVRVRRSQAAIMPPALPEAMRRAIAGSARAVSGARLAAALPVSVPRVIEASREVSERVAEAWLLESSRDASPLAPVDAKGLRRLESAGVPPRVIDVMVALSYPRHFQVAMADGGRGEVTEVSEPAAGGAPAPRGMYGNGIDYAMYGHPRCFTYSCHWFYSDRSYYYYGLAGWNSYGGWGMYPGWGYPQPIVVVRPSTGGGGGGGGGGAPPTRGRAEKGEGYRRDGGSGGTAQPRTQDAGAASGTAGSTKSSSGSGGSARGSGSSGGSSSSAPKGEAKPREAKPRKP